ncbi:LLM class flavin-dependent oxidoreductase [Candidatus Thorarchaeota archaeon]|nr:MAG: LLM class flavin-dependent oxidoreductase [Candidatus Thorarchaeota archaeon]
MQNEFGLVLWSLPYHDDDLGRLLEKLFPLDHLSKGRLILGVGIGAPPDVEFEYFGEASNSKVRAEMLDESLDIITGLWTGKPFSYSDKYYQLEEMTFLPKPKQSPRIPIWVGGGIPHKAPFKRAARYDGVAPVHSRWPEPVTTEDLDSVLGVVCSERTNLNDYDIILCGETTGTDSQKDKDTLNPWMERGVTWWLEDINGMRAEVDVLRERIRAGPPEV